MTDDRARRPHGPKPLKWIVADLLARHVDELVDLAGDSLLNIPPDVRDAMLATARRVGCLDDATLRALVDESTTIIDAGGCGNGRVTDAGIEALAARHALRNVVAVDVSGCDGVTAEGMRILASAAPRLTTLRCGGNATCNAACEAAVADDDRGIVPRLEDGGGVDHWETRADVDETSADGNGKQQRRRLQSLEWLVWPDVRPVTRAGIVRRCPKIRIVAPPREIHDRASVAVADPIFVAVAGEGWVGFGAKAGSAPGTTGGGSPGTRGCRLPGMRFQRGFGRGEDNDGLVVVAAGGGAARRTRWWLDEDETVGTFSPPPIHADPTRALDAAHLAPLDPRVYGGSIDTDKGADRDAQRGTKGTGLGEDIGAKGTKGGVSATGAQTASALEGGALRWRLKFAEDDVPIAERFRRAYLEVDAERAARREKNSQKRKNRNLNRMFTSSSERHIYRALDDISLVDRY